MRAAGLESAVADVTADRDRQTRDLVRTLRRLGRNGGGASAAVKIAGLEEDKRAAERALNALTADLENVTAELARSRHLLGAEAAGRARDMADAGHELAETRRRADEQQRAAADYVVDGLRKLEALRRENDALKTHAASLTAVDAEPRVDVGSQTFPTGRDRDGVATFSRHADEEEQCGCRRLVAALRKKAAKNKSHDASKWNEYMSNVRIKGAPPTVHQ